jgi:hypothetical protein
LPDFIRGFVPSNCPYQHLWCLQSKNIYELPGLQNERKLFATERMTDRNGREVEWWRLGDWNCDLLLLLQDTAPVDGIRAWVGKHSDPFSATNFVEEPSAGGARTNRNLYELSHSIECRKLVGSALIGILKPGSSYSGPIRECQYVRDHCLRVLAWVMNRTQTPNLRAIVCLGKTATDFISHIQRRDLVDCSRFRVAHLPHPSRYPPGGKPVATAAWNRMAIEFGLRIR